MSEDTDKKRKRLLYQASYRGFKEADLLIGGFAKTHIASLDENELAQFEALLQLNDRELYAYATGKLETPKAYAGAVMDQLKAFNITSIDR